MRALFAGTGLELTLERATLALPPFESAEAEIAYHTSKMGALIRARRRAEAEGRWPALEAELASLHDELGSAEYLVVLGRKPAPGESQ